MNLKKSNRQHTISSFRGFTLVELLVVMFIIATLAAITSTWAYRAYKRSKTTAKTTYYQQLFIANQSYIADHGGMICPAKSHDGLWRELLVPYLSSEKNAYRDPLFREYDKNNADATGVGMAIKLLAPSDNKKNKWDTEEEATPIAMSEITFTGRRIFMGDSKGWLLNDAKLDATRHEEKDSNGQTEDKGMFLFFDGTVRLLTKEDAEKGLNAPESLEF